MDLTLALGIRSRKRLIWTSGGNIDARPGSVWVSAAALAGNAAPGNGW